MLLSARTCSAVLPPMPLFVDLALVQYLSTVCPAYSDMLSPISTIVIGLAPVAAKRTPKINRLNIFLLLLRTIFVKMKTSTAMESAHRSFAGLRDLFRECLSKLVKCECRSQVHFSFECHSRVHWSVSVAVECSIGKLRYLGEAVLFEENSVNILATPWVITKI